VIILIANNSHVKVLKIFFEILIRPWFDAQYHKKMLNHFYSSKRYLLWAYYIENIVPYNGRKQKVYSKHNEWVNELMNNVTVWQKIHTYKHPKWDLLSFILFFKVGGDGSGVWTQGLVLAKQELYCLNYISSSFCSGYVGDGVFQTICPGWPWTSILPQSQPPKKLRLQA
jgi:hypothetical protein